MSLGSRIAGLSLGRGIVLGYPSRMVKLAGIERLVMFYVRISEGEEVLVVGTRLETSA